MARQGFTLLEVLVVLTILALLVAVLPSPFVGLSGARLSAAADDLADTMRGLRDAAIRQGNPMEITLDLAGRSYAFTGEAFAHQLPAVVDAVAFEEARAGVADDSVRVQFFPDGSATGGTMVLRHGAAARRISIDWLTGRVRRE